MELDYIQRRDKTVLEKLTKDYVRIILNEYSNEANPILKKRLLTLDNFSDLVHIKDTGTITVLATKKGLFFPIEAYKVIKAISHIPGYGRNPLHKTYSDGDRINNNNTYETFIKHCIIKGMTPLDYFKEGLLRECMHLCGGNGRYALFEGINELKSRELAEKYDLELSCCGYPKEVKIALELQEILGKDLMDKIEFEDPEEIYSLIQKEKGKEYADFYNLLNESMNREFESYMRTSYSGVLSPMKKTKSYNKIDYSKSYQIIDTFKKEHKNSFTNN